VRADLGQDALLRRGGFERQDALERFTDARLAHGERDASLLPRLLAAQRQAELVEEEFLEDQPLVRGRAKGVEGFDILGRWREVHVGERVAARDRKSTRLNSSHGSISYAVFCLKKKN